VRPCCEYFINSDLYPSAGRRKAARMAGSFMSVKINTTLDLLSDAATTTTMDWLSDDQPIWFSTVPGR